MSEYGEPWRITSKTPLPDDAWLEVFDKNDECVHYDSMNEGELPECVARWERIIACVNAMRYVDDPDAFMGHIRSAIREQHSIAGIAKHISNATKHTDFEVNT